MEISYQTNSPSVSLGNKPGLTGVSCFCGAEACSGSHGTQVADTVKFGGLGLFKKKNQPTNDSAYKPQLTFQQKVLRALDTPTKKLQWGSGLVAAGLILAIPTGGVSLLKVIPGLGLQAWGIAEMLQNRQFNNEQAVYKQLTALNGLPLTGGTGHSGDQLGQLKQTVAQLQQEYNLEPLDLYKVTHVLNKRLKGSLSPNGEQVNLDVTKLQEDLSAQFSSHRVEPETIDVGFEAQRVDGLSVEQVRDQLLPKLFSFYAQQQD